MDEDRQLYSFLDSTPDSALFDYVPPSDKIKVCLSKFGLTVKESKMFIYLGKYGSSTASEISETLKITRTETYRILRSLQNRGIVSASIDHPYKFSCLSILDAIDVLIETEVENVKTLRVQKDIIMNSWQSIPMFGKEDNWSHDEKFQIIRGQNSIMGKINQMFLGAKKSLALFGSERFFFNLHHSDLLDVLSDCKYSLRILTSGSQKSTYIFKGLEGEVKFIPCTVQNELCFVVKDNTELLTFVKSAFELSQKTLAMHTDCASLIYTTTFLFNQIWSGACHNIEHSTQDYIHEHLSR